MNFCHMKRYAPMALSLALGVRAIPTAPAATLYVATTGSDGNAGTSWTLALRTISNAVARTGDGLVMNKTRISSDSESARGR